MIDLTGNALIIINIRIMLTIMIVVDSKADTDDGDDVIILMMMMMLFVIILLLPKLLILTIPPTAIMIISIYKLGDVNILSNLISWLSLANGQCPPPGWWIMKQWPA